MNPIKDVNVIMTIKDGVVTFQYEQASEPSSTIYEMYEKDGITFISLQKHTDFAPLHFDDDSFFTEYDGDSFSITIMKENEIQIIASQGNSHFTWNGYYIKK